MNQSKLTDLTVENILSIGVSVKMQITDSVSENLTKEHGPANAAVEAISMILFFIINGKSSAIE